jgi:hypothetical protein
VSEKPTNIYALVSEMNRQASVHNRTRRAIDEAREALSHGPEGVQEALAVLRAAAPGLQALSGPEED